MKRFMGLVAVLALTVATSLSSFAGYDATGGSLGGSFVSKSPNTGILGDAFAVTDLYTNNFGHTGDFATGFGGVMFFDGTYNFGAAPITVGTSVSFSSAAYGTFIGTVTSDSGVAGDNDVLSRQITFVGTYTPGTDGAFNGNTTPLANTTMQLTVSKSSANGTHSGNWTMDTTAAAAVPEPASIAIFGLGAAGLAVRRFRRK